jgi:hypothetical protein
VGEVVVVKPKVQGNVTKWEVAGHVPAGLALDSTTAVISGIPAETGDEQEYAITASNEAGGTSVVMSFGTSAPPPTSHPPTPRHTPGPPRSGLSGSHKLVI